MGTSSEEGDLVARLRENLVRLDNMRLGGDLVTLADWQHEALRQDRERGKLVVKLAKIQKVLQEHQHCETLCDVILDIQDVINDAD